MSTSHYFRTFGVTEPAIYGITLPKNAVLLSMIGGAVAGAFLMINGTTSYTSGGLGVGAFNYITQKAMLVACGSLSSES